ncbi:hypothetical protein ACFL5G_02955 [Candidatus Margulisiibacteriota bacterium]
MALSLNSYAYQLVTASATTSTPKPQVATSNSYRSESTGIIDPNDSPQISKGKKYRVSSRMSFQQGQVSTGNTEIELFVSSHSPESVAMITNILNLVGQRKLDREDISFVYLCRKDQDGEWEFPFEEIGYKEDVRRMVLAKHWPREFISYLKLRNINVMDNEYEQYLVLAGIDPVEVDRKVEEEKEKLLEENYAKLKARDVHKVPEVFYKGERKALKEGYLTELIRAIGLSARLQEQATLNVLVITADVYGMKRAIDSFKDIFKLSLSGLTFEEIDHKSSEARKLINLFDIDRLPVYIFPEEFSGTNLYAEFEKEDFLVRENDLLMISQNAVETVYFFKRPKYINELDLFVMSQCPFGTVAENKILEKVDLNKIRLKIRYIVSKDDEGNFQSLHGPAELEEDLRQICVAENYPKKLGAYLIERNENIYSTYWNLALEKAGIPTAKIMDCVIGSGKARAEKTLKKDNELAEELGIGASPSFLWQNQILLNSESIQEVPEFKDIKINPGSCN